MRTHRSTQLANPTGGIRFELIDTKPPAPKAAQAAEAESQAQEPAPPPTSYIYLKSVPLTFPKMFQQYFQLGNHIRRHYLSPRVLLCLVTGQFVPPIHREELYSLQYSMLPARRTGVLEMWRLTTGGGVHGQGHGAKTKGSWSMMGGRRVWRR